MNTTTTLDALLGDMPRVRAAARSFVRDAASADDLVQDALVVALRKRREVVAVTSGWTRTTLRNLTRNEARARTSREARERQVARNEAQPAASEAAALAERSRDVSEALLGLAEPYRTVVLLRYVEELPPRKIAARMGATVEAVKKQLTRGQAQLKRKLEDRYGDRGAWAVALLPLTGPKVLATAKAVGALGAAMRAGALLLALGGAAVLVAEVRQEPAIVAPIAPEPDRLVDVATAPSERTPAGSTPASVGPASLALETEASPGAAAAAKPPLEPTEAIDDTSVYRGRMVDLNGDPIQGLRIEWIQKGLSNVRTNGNTTWFGELPPWLWRRVNLVTNSEGAFSIDRYPLPDDPNAEWVFKGPPRVSIAAGLDSTGAMVWVMAPAVQVAGIVRDAEMRPVAEASVSVSAGLRELPLFPLRLSEISQGGLLHSTSEDGRFDLGAVPFHPAFRIHVRRKDSSSASIPVPSTGGDAVVIQLPEMEAKRKAAVFGRVVAADGTPESGISVQLRRRTVKTNENGEFRFDSLTALDYDESLIAQRKNLEFCAVPVPRVEDALAPGGAGPIELRFPSARLRLRGQLVDAGGQPAEGYLVYVMNGTEGPLRWLREHARPGQGSAEPLTTGSSGVFTVPQMLKRPYHLRFMDPETLQVHDVEAIVPSAGPVRVALPANGMITELSGVALDAFGEPVPNARLQLSALTLQRERMSFWRTRDLGTTDDRGAFTLKELPREDVVLSATPEGSPGGQPIQFELTKKLTQAPLKLRLDLECSFEVVNTSGREIDALEFHTDSGERLTGNLHRPDLRSSFQRFEAEPGGTFRFGSVSQRATQVVLFHGDQEIGRQGIRLQAKGPNVIDL